MKYYCIQDINAFCDKEGLLYVETSALSGEGVNTLFQSIGMNQKMIYYGYSS